MITFNVISHLCVLIIGVVIGMIVSNQKMSCNNHWVNERRKNGKNERNRN